MTSFIRKYAAMADMTEKDLQTLFEFRPVTIGHDLYISGAKFKFYYSFHAIPCIGFEAEYEGKTLFFSGDTFYDPVGLKDLYENKKVFKKARYEMLSGWDWNKYDCILHEAGVPPIHTPMKVLAALPDHIKAKMYLVHCSSKDVTPESGLLKAPIGIENTIVIFSCFLKF